MHTSGNSLRAFLVSAKHALHRAVQKQEKVTLVIGNESADLDSITSSVLYAYLRSSQPRASNNDAQCDAHVPLLNIPKADINIRPELLALLRHANAEPSHLITLDDVAFSQSSPNVQNESLDNDKTYRQSLQPDRKGLRPGNTRLVLVDHNALDGRLASLSEDTSLGFRPSIVACIDHHDDEHQIPLDTGDEPRIIQKCGSCTSLVLEYLRPAWDRLSASALHFGAANAQKGDAAIADDDAVRRTWDAQIAKMAVSSILVDTQCLRDGNKTTDVDKRAVEYLEAKIQIAPVGAGRAYEREAFFEEITAAKSNLDALTVEDCLRKDFKTWSLEEESAGKNNVLGVSSMVKPLSWLMDKACKELGGDSKIIALREKMNHYAAGRGLAFQATMTASTSDEGKFQREFMLLAVDGSRQQLLDDFEAQSKEELGLEAWNEVTGSVGQGMKIWWQRNLSKSRKQVGPLLRELLTVRVT